MFHTWWPKTRPWCAATRAPSGCGAQRPPSARALRALAHGRSDVSESFRVECKFPLFIKCVTLPIIENTGFSFIIRYYNGSFWHQNWVPKGDAYRDYSRLFGQNPCQSLLLENRPFWAHTVNGRHSLLAPIGTFFFGTNWHTFGTRWHILFPCVASATHILGT